MRALCPVAALRKHRQPVKGVNGKTAARSGGAGESPSSSSSSSSSPRERGRISALPRPPPRPALRGTAGPPVAAAGSDTRRRLGTRDPSGSARDARGLTPGKRERTEKARPGSGAHARVRGAERRYPPPYPAAGQGAGHACYAQQVDARRGRRKAAGERGAEPGRDAGPRPGAPPRPAPSRAGLSHAEPSRARGGGGAARGERGAARRRGRAGTAAARGSALGLRDSGEDVSEEQAAPLATLLPLRRRSGKSRRSVRVLLVGGTDRLVSAWIGA